MTTDINAYTRIAKIVSIEDIGKSGLMQARLVGSPEGDLPINVQYTSPYYVPVNGKEAARFTGLVAFPGVGAFILICSSPDDHQWYYISTITGKAGYFDDLKNTNTGGDDETELEGGPEGTYESYFPGSHDENASTYSHGPIPSKYTFESPLGGKLQMSDSTNGTDQAWYTKLESITKKRFIADDTNDYVAVQNEHGDGLKITSTEYNNNMAAGPDPGPRAASLYADKNITVESNQGSLELLVRGGTELNIENRSVNNDQTRMTPLDPMTGEVNIQSYANSVNITALGKDILQGGTKLPSPKGVFIDASQFDGVVQIRAGTGGVEIWSNGDIDFNCAGNFNVNAKGDINLKGASENVLNTWATAGKGEVHLNPPKPPGLKPWVPTLNNLEQFPKA